jgi:hypothetical protein
MIFMFVGEMGFLFLVAFGLEYPQLGLLPIMVSRLKMGYGYS